MKKVTILLIAFLTVFSCGDDVEFNTPGFQGLREYGLWRADFYSAQIAENGVLTITGGNNAEKVELITPTVIQTTTGTPGNAADENPFVFGDVDTIEAKYTDASGTIYSTNNRPDPEVSIYPELGDFHIDEIDFNKGTISGRFTFLAFNTSGEASIGFNDGVFTKIPITGVIPVDPYTCQDGEDAAEIALAAFQSTFAEDLVYISSGAYTAACQAYVLALENQRNFCGDVSGEIQEAIDALNGCAFPCNFAMSNSANALAALEEANLGNYIELCTTYVNYLTEQIEVDVCGDEDGAIQALIDARDCGDDDEDGIPNVYEDFNGDGELNELDDSDGDGIPNYLDNDDDGDGVSTIDEAKDENGIPIDSDMDGLADYLDRDDDNDGLLTIFETAQGDTDGNGIPDYLDNDDDGDGMLTIDENADTNNDGNPDDAVDSDANGTPDYLQA